MICVRRRLDRAEVTDTESRRQSILEATIHVVGRQGYAGTSVADVIAEAGVSRTTFYNHFADRHECFRAAYPIAVGRVQAAVGGGCGGEERPWVERARAALEAVVELFAVDPELARTTLVEAAAAGGEPLARRQAALERMAQLLGTGDDVPRARELPPGTAQMAVGAVTGLLFDEIRAGRAGELPDRLPDLLFALLVPYLGPREAAAEALTLKAA